MLRTFFKSDLPQIVAIEQAVHIAPWTEETFKACFQSGHHCFVVELDKKIIGFAISSAHSGECHVLNIGIAREYQHQGWGRKLLQHLLQQAKREGAGIAYLEVRRSNTRAISLYRKMHFHLVGERKNYYPTVSGQEDALVFAKSLHEEI
ncbi:ribosomal protein S18-alanine N-acetyltransferase [Aquicella lusitana]|uniref:[Ribosomal protein bS18]-alanine N-acetyltransferase n=1 Tax=Aquicella lusitana TaxID=254246 RepID=A0A370G3X0_9COXI|nr:ribosomal protein S18-alanine N-acetyltransferase [Aquicella lusitana]RDI38445.1 [SSU ribosomal protein S18P]-alanine acetyltransferase [Aquicella lusitana]VVC73754.1 Mycothiol acetyltransferase [Aquicella lusitana]